jgi:hypothetical protein
VKDVGRKPLVLITPAAKSLNGFIIEVEAFLARSCDRRWRRATWLGSAQPRATVTLETELHKIQRLLSALPVRRALVEEGIHSLPEILSHIGAKNQILALVAR